MARILTVDDEQSILDVVCNILKTTDHEVVPALGAGEALKILEEEEFDLMISDIRMFPIDGMTLLRHVREAAPLMDVIMLTGYGQVDTAIEARELGAFDYLKKPFQKDQLLDKVDKALEFRKLNMGGSEG